MVMKYRTSVFLFYKDLRIADHPALHKACVESKTLLPVCIKDDTWWESTQFSMGRIGQHQAVFYHESVTDLKKQLREEQSDLFTFTGDSVQVLEAIKEIIDFDSIFYSEEDAVEEQELINRLKQAFPTVEFNSVHSGDLYNRAELPTPVASLPNVFTKFRKQAEKQAVIPALMAKPVIPPLPDSCTALRSNRAKFNEQQPPKSFPKTKKFKGGSNAAFAHLSWYFSKPERPKSYKETRNGLLGMDYSTKFSPWLAWGCISPRTIYWRLKDFERIHGSNASTYWIYFELQWRDFFRFHASKYGAAIFSKSGIQVNIPEAQPNESWFEAWKRGETGIPFIDANMRELAQTGFMSNRGRQNVASFLVHDLKQDWRWGAAWFEQQLIDYDVYSNWCNWNYVAGVGTDPRKQRYFNVIKQAKGYDPDGAFVRHWIPEIEQVSGAFVHQPYLSGAPLPQTYEAPIYCSPRW